MSPDVVIDILREAFKVTVLLAAPMLLSAMLVGLLVGMIQAATQINEMTLSFIPKLLILVVILVAGGPWMVRLIVDYTIRMYENIPTLIG